MHFAGVACDGVDIVGLLLRSWFPPRHSGTVADDAEPYATYAVDDSPREASHGLIFSHVVDVLASGAVDREQYYLPDGGCLHWFFSALAIAFSNKSISSKET